MAELLKIKSEVEEFRKAYFYTNSQAEENRQREHQAATRIQSWFRACKVRAYLSHLHKKAIIIQKIWRGFTARARFRQMVTAAYFIMKMNFYEEMAVRSSCPSNAPFIPSIQQRWRGFFVRKYIHNFYARKSYLEGLSMKNELVSLLHSSLSRVPLKDIHERRTAMVERVRACLHACPAITLCFYAMELGELEELQKRERDCVEMVKEQTAKVYQAHRLHHLLSTEQKAGVFNSPFRPAPHEMELLLRQVKYQAPTRLAPRGRACLLGMPGPTSPSFPGTLGSPWIKTTGTRCFSRPILPPIATKKQQGLLREPGEMWEQRVRCPDLTLRLQTSYTHLEEAQKQLRQHESMRSPTGTLGTGSMLHHLSPSRNSFTQPAYANSFR